MKKQGVSEGVEFFMQDEGKSNYLVGMLLLRDFLEKIDNNAFQQMLNASFTALNKSEFLFVVNIAIDQVMMRLGYSSLQASDFEFNIQSFFHENSFERIPDWMLKPTSPQSR